MKKSITVFLLLFNVNYALAETTDTAEEPKQYDIEIIIFEDAHARYINSESWNRNNYKEEDALLVGKTENDILKGSKVSELDISSKTYKPLQPTMLNKEYRRIKNSSEFNVLLYSAWRQIGLKKSEAFDINIEKLNNAHMKNSKNTITGTLKIVLARYLHFYSQIEYQLQSNTISSETTPPENENITDTKAKVSTPEVYPIQSHRRMRSKELHYIDHPLVGILIKINPVEVKQIEKP